MSLDERTGHVVLTIADHLNWHDSASHQHALQTKFNAYLAFVESGEVFQRYPESKGRPIAFKVVFKYRPDKEGQEFLAKAREVIEKAGFELRSEVFAESYDN